MLHPVQLLQYLFQHLLLRILHHLQHQIQYHMIFFKKINIDTISVWIDITSVSSNINNAFVGYFDMKIIGFSLENIFFFFLCCLFFLVLYSSICNNVCVKCD